MVYSIQQQMSKSPDFEVDIDEETVNRIRERVLLAEKEQLHLKLPQGIISKITQIIVEEVD
ncbi:hypothetical protein [Haladaptatus sp. CMSO5]|uniref:hypothetical protein n=1 Tax=Haladaptatus sp. CMSO5 TaxID=3120514 RepID=UPI002FCE08CE